jgi:hypothetical protein
VLLLPATGSIAAAPGDTAPTREAKRQQIRRALLVPEALPALEAEHYGQVEIAPGVIVAQTESLRPGVSTFCW